MSSRRFLCWYSLPWTATKWLFSPTARLAVGKRTRRDGRRVRGPHGARAREERAALDELQRERDGLLRARHRRLLGRRLLRGGRDPGPHAVRPDLPRPRRAGRPRVLGHQELVGRGLGR